MDGGMDGYILVNVPRVCVTGFLRILHKLRCMVTCVALHKRSCQLLASVQFYKINQNIILHRHLDEVI